MHVPDESRSQMELMVNPRLMTHMGIVFKVEGYTHKGIKQLRSSFIVKFNVKCVFSHLLDYVPQSVMHVLLGGGSSFSSGGPGKGMYSKLYTQVLNQYHWWRMCRYFLVSSQSLIVIYICMYIYVCIRVDSAIASSFQYSDVGLLGIYGTYVAYMCTYMYMHNHTNICNYNVYSCVHVLSC